MNINLTRLLQLLVLTLATVLLATPPVSAENKWDGSAHQINSRGDKIPTARGHHDSDQDDEDEKDDDDCKSKNKCGSKKSCEDKDDDDDKK